VNEDIRVAAPAEEIADRIAAVLGALPKARVSRPGPWQYVLVLKHIPAWAALPGIAIMVLFVRVPLTLMVSLYEEADSKVVVRLQGATELSVLERLRAQIDSGPAA
jgi:hypothetical protein